MIMNDFSARRLQMENDSEFRSLKGKDFVLP